MSKIVARLALLALGVAGSPLAAQSAPPSAPSEVMKTKTADVVISPNRYRGRDLAYPQAASLKPADPRAAQLCNDASDSLRDPAAPTGWSVETHLLQAAGSSPSEPLETQRAKIARWWSGANLECSLLGSFEKNFLQMLIKPSIDGYRIVDRIVLKYQLPLNDVTSDGRTVLDVVADKIDEAPADVSWGSSYTRIYGTLRRFGARHRKELEADGTLPTPQVLMQRRIAGLTAKANAGDASAAYSLAWDYTRGGYVTPDLAQATRWLDRAEALALQTRNGPVLAAMGQAYLDPPTDPKAGLKPQPAPFSGRRDRAVRVLEAAATANYTPEQAIWDQAFAKFYLGYAYYMGLGTAQNWDRALQILAPLDSDASAQVFSAEILLSRGRRAEAIEHLRNVAFSSQGNAPFKGSTVGGWLRAQPEGLCGRDSTGYVHTGC
jgi:hypothetical protein